MKSEKAICDIKVKPNTHRDLKLLAIDLACECECNFTLDDVIQVLYNFYVENHK